MKYFLIFALIFVSVGLAGTVVYERHDHVLDDDFTLKDFVIWNPINDFDPSMDWFFVFGAIQCNSLLAFKNVALNYDFYSGTSLVASENTLIDYYTYQDRGMRSNSIAFTIELMIAVVFDRVEISITHDGPDTGRDLFLLTDALSLSDVSVTEMYPGSVYSTWEGVLTNAALDPLDDPRVFCCAYNEGHLVTINEVSPAELGKASAPIEPGESIPFRKVVEVPTAHDSIACYTHYSIEGSGMVELPVELAAFTASAHEDCIQLQWKTESETNNYGFFVEKQKNNLSWETLGFIAGHQTSTCAHEYVFYDFDAYTGKNHYRLVQVDTDGTRTRYPSIAVSYNAIPDQCTLEQNYPNPFNAATWIRYSLSSASPVKIAVYNTNGELLKTLVDELQNAGSYKIKVDMSTFSSGIYYYTLSANTIKKSASMLLVK